MQKELMKGFPPSAELQVTLANWRKAPSNIWSFQHVRELIPTADIPNDPGNVRKLPSVSQNTFADLSIETEGAVYGLKRSCARPIPTGS
jgi:hypothetical protein